LWASGRGAPEPGRREERSDERSRGEGAVTAAGITKTRRAAFRRPMFLLITDD